MTGRPLSRVRFESSHVRDVDAIAVDLWYPRMDDIYKHIIVTLMDVRAANDIIITYDFDRDGWVIKSNLYDPESHEGIDSDKPEELHEVAFVPSWPLVGSTNEIDKARLMEVTALLGGCGLTQAEFEVFFVEFSKGSSEWFELHRLGREGDEKAQLVVDLAQKYEKLLGEKPWLYTNNEEVIKPILYQIYMGGLVDENFYAREAEESGLLSVYKAGFEAGRKER